MKRVSVVKLFLAGGFALAATAAFAKGPAVQCTVASFESAPASQQKKGKWRFSAKAVLEVRPIVTLARSSDPGDTLEVRFFTPTGNLYEARAFTIPTEEETEERDRHRRSRDREKDDRGRGEGGNREEGRGEDRGKNNDELSRDDLAAPALLVGGTAISSSSIFGTWRAEIWAPGARRRACASSFEITR